MAAAHEHPAHQAPQQPRPHPQGQQAARLARRRLQQPRLLPALLGQEMRCQRPVVPAHVQRGVLQPGAQRRGSPFESPWLAPARAGKGRAP